MLNLTITDVRAQKGDSAFLIDDGKTAILYDSGFAFTGYAVADNIKAILGDRPLDYIFLTHSHYDHALGSVYALKYWPDAKVVAGEYAAKIFSKPTAKNVMRDLDKKFAAACGVDEYEDLIDNLRVDIPVQDNDKIQAGDMLFTAINLPGHTKCSVGYYLESERLLLSCETIGVYDGDQIVMPSYLVGYEMTLDSISKVEALDIKSILLPHFGLLSEEKTRFYLQNARRSATETCDEIAKLLRAGNTKEQVVEFFKDKFYKDNIRVIYPIDAMNLNTNITVDLIARELGIEITE
ncbi:MAG: MBL fold metallo-hydrolase [Ruminococcus sp.]|nr:MBL fold metallo-hydrolase [Ruminococcus sp.]